MSYATRGNSCNTSSIALTSNAKYLPPLSKVYYDRWTDMLLYPGRTGFTYPFQHPFGPEVLKAWNLEDMSNQRPERRIVYPDVNNFRHERHQNKRGPIQQIRKHCAHCKTRN